MKCWTKQFCVYLCHLYSGTLLVVLTCNVPAGGAGRAGEEGSCQDRQPGRKGEVWEKQRRCSRGHFCFGRSTNQSRGVTEERSSVLIKAVGAAPQCERTFKYWDFWSLGSSLCFILLSIWAICTLLTLFGPFALY